MNKRLSKLENGLAQQLKMSATTPVFNIEKTEYTVCVGHLIITLILPVI